MRRMLSNRESARRSRRRKQAVLGDLELQVANLQMENSSLFNNLTDLTQKFNDMVDINQVLKRNIIHMQQQLDSGARHGGQRMMPGVDMGSGSLIQGYGVGTAPSYHQYQPQHQQGPGMAGDNISRSPPVDVGSEYPAVHHPQQPRHMPYPPAYINKDMSYPPGDGYAVGQGESYAEHSGPIPMSAAQHTHNQSHLGLHSYPDMMATPIGAMDGSPPNESDTTAHYPSAFTSRVAGGLANMDKLGDKLPRTPSMQRVASLEHLHKRNRAAGMGSMGLPRGPSLTQQLTQQCENPMSGQYVMHVSHWPSM